MKLKIENTKFWRSNKACVFICILICFKCHLVLAQNLELGIPVGHTKEVNTAFYSPDRNYIVTSSDDFTARIWDASSGKPLIVLEGHSQVVNSASFSPNGRHIITSSDSTVRIWETSTGRLTKMLVGHSNTVSTAFYNPDGTFIVTSSDDFTARIWEVSSGRLLHVLEGHTERVNSASYSPNGKYIVTSSSDGTVRVWEAFGGKLKNILYGHSSGVNFASFGPEGELLISASTDGTVRVWEVNNGKLLKTYFTKGSIVEDVSISSDGSRIISNSFLTSDSNSPIYSVELWQIPNGDSKLLYNGNDKVNFVDFVPDRKQVIIVIEDKVNIMDEVHKNLYTELVSHTGEVKYSALTLDNQLMLIVIDGKCFIKELTNGRIYQFKNKYLNNVSLGPFGRLMLGSPEGSFNVHLWNILTGELIHVLEGHTGNIIEAKFSPNGKLIATTSRDRTVRVWETTTGRLVIDTSSKMKWARSVNFSPNSELIAVGSMNEKITIIWDLSSRKLLHSIDGVKKGYAPPIFSPTENTVVISQNYAIHILDNSTGELINSLSSPHSMIVKNEFSSNGEYLITSHFDGIISVRETSNWELKYAIKTKGRRFWIDPGNSYIITASNTGLLKKWDLESGKLLLTYAGHIDIINSLSWFSNKKFMLSASNDGSTIIWDIHSGKKLIQQFIFDEDPDKWAILAGEGLFDASSAGMRMMYWTKGLEVVEFSQLKDRFYEPVLLQKVLGYSNEPLRESRGLNNIELYPVVRVGNVENGKNIDITLTNRGGGIGKVKIFINGKEVASDARGPKTNPDAPTVILDYNIENHPYLIPGKENEITVQAYNKEGYLVSRGVTVTYKPKEEKIEAPNLYGVIVGSSNYRGDQLDLKYAAKDANDFSKALQMVGNKYFGKEKVNITTLTTDDKDFDMWPTKSNIERVFKEISTTAGPEDVIVVYMSGHGTNYGGTEGDFYYLTSEANNFDLKDPVIRETTAISSNEWTDYFKWVPALKQVLIIDACRSGQLADDIMEVRADKSSAEIRALERMKDRTGMYILSGSAADAVSYETSVYGQGLLTYSLLQGMKGAALREEKFVDVMQLFEYAANTVPKLAENIGGIQKPEVRVPYGGGSFDIGISDEQVQERIVLPSPKPIFLRSVFQNDETFADDLNLSEQLDEQLRDISSRGVQEQTVIFVDARKYTDAYSLKGRYSKEGDEYKVDVRLFKGDENIERIEFMGDKSELGSLIIDKILTLLE